MCKFCLFTALALLFVTTAYAGEPPVTYTPEQIIEKSIAFHDPHGVWGTGRFHLSINTAYSQEYAKKSGAKSAIVTLLIAPGHETFSYIKTIGGDKIEITVNKGEGSVAVNGSTRVSDEDKERLRLAEATLYRDYCEYLYGMPMKLRDPGTILDPRVSSMQFDGREVWQLRVTYDPEVGSHTWYFYFDPDTFALVGYRFYKDESKNDGEYITFEGEIIDKASGLRLPKTRAWYYNADGKHLATDDIVSLDSRR